MQEMSSGSLQMGAAPASPDEKIEKNFFRDFFGIIFDPRKAYDNIIKAKYWVVMLIVFLLVIGITEQFYHNVLIDFQVKEIQKSVQESDTPPPGLDQQMQFFENEALTRPIYFGTTVLGQGVMLIIGALIVFFFCSVLAGGTAKFGGVWMIYVWSSVITIVDFIIKTPLMIFKNDMKAGLNLGLIFSESMVGSKMNSVLSSVDIFGIWHFIVLGIGVSVLYKFTVKKGITITFIIWLLFTIISAIVVYVS